MTQRDTMGPRVLLVEDEALSRSLLASLLRSAGYIVDAHASARAAALAFPSLRPVAVVSDIDLHEGPSGIDLVVALKKRDPALRIIILSNYAIAPDNRHAALASAAYLNKRELDDPSLLISTLRDLLDQQPRPMDTRMAAGRLAALTLAQAEVLRMVAAGMTNEEIASRRHTTVKSVENMIHRIIVVLGLPHDASSNSRVLAARLFIQEAGQVGPPHRRFGG